MAKRNLALALSVAAMALPSAPAMAATTIASLATGTNVASGRDQEWLVSGIGTNVTLNGAIQAFVPTVNNAVPSTWNGGAANPVSNGARWITPLLANNGSAGSAGKGITSYVRKFSISNLAGITALVLAGDFFADNQIRNIFFNNSTLYTNDDPEAEINQFTNGTNFSFTTTDFGEDNTLIVDVYNGGGQLGFKTNVAVSAVPEPGTWMLLLLGFGAIGFSMRFRQKSQGGVQFA